MGKAKIHWPEGSKVVKDTLAVLATAFVASGIMFCSDMVFGGIISRFL